MERVRRLFDDTLFSDFPFVNALCEHVRGYRGKMLRPALLLLSGRAAGGLADEHIALAVVVEMIHLATLLHDDVLDGAEVRRKRQTVNVLQGNETAVLLGDYLVSHAYHLCGRLGSRFAVCRIGATTNTVCEGELMQIHHRGNCRLTEAEYFEIITRKTAALTAVCGELGAHFAGAPQEQVAALEAYGRHAGIAFQIVDDVLDLIGSTETMGKTLGRDLDLGKPTLPLIHCLSSGDTAAAAQLAAVLGNGLTASASEVCAWLDRTGSVAYAMQRAADHVMRAVAHLEAFPPGPARDSLAGIAHFIAFRQQ